MKANDSDETFLLGNAQDVAERSPEQRLVIAVIRRAIFDASWNRAELKDKRQKRRNVVAQRDARVWLRSESHEEGSFLWYLSLAGMDTEIQKKILSLCDTLEQRLEDEAVTEEDTKILLEDEDILILMEEEDENY